MGLRPVRFVCDWLVFMRLPTEKHHRADRFSPLVRTFLHLFTDFISCDRLLGDQNRLPGYFA